MKLSEHFTLEEFCLSETAVRLGINNEPSNGIIDKLALLCETSLEPLRLALNHPIHILSGYRSWELNQAVGGSETSQHCLGEAVDIVVQSLTVEEVFQFAARNVPYDQLIQEFDRWTHISNKPSPRKQTMRAIKEDGRTKYIPAFIG